MRAKIVTGYLLAMSLAFSVFLLTGCSFGKTDDTVIATVNGQPLYLKELKRELAIKVRQNPSLGVNKKTLDDITGTLVDKHLILQEATRKGMTKEQKFADTIKAFWEQALIRDFIEYRNRQVEPDIFVTDKEVEDHYEELQKQGAELPPLEDIREPLRERIGQIKKLQAFEGWLDDKRRKSEIRINEELIYKKALK